MLDQLLKLLTPDIIIKAIRDNPQVIIDTLQKFDTFKLLGESLSTNLQIVLSNNSKYLNEYLRSNEGKSATRLWVEGFAGFVADIHNKTTTAEGEEITLTIPDTSMLEAKLRKELEVKIRKEIEEKMRKEVLKTKEVEVPIVSKK